MDRRSMMMMTGIGVLTAALPVPEARANRLPRPAQPPPGAGAVGVPVFSDEFDGPLGSPPDPAKWTIATARELIRNPAHWDRPENMGQYRDDRQNVYLDGNSNLVIRATREGTSYFGGKISGNWRGGIGLTWEARVKLQCLTAGCWPAWWMMTTDPARGGEIDVLEWFGNGGWAPGSTVHTLLDGTVRATNPIEVDTEWHTWRCQWDHAGIRFWKDYFPGALPYFDVPAGSLEAWPFNDPGYQMYPILNLAVSGSGGGDPSTGVYPADMLVDYIRVW
jgi:beta-glucanase (GH16 family)